MINLHRAILEEGQYFITSIDEFHDTVERRQNLLRTLARQHNSCALVAEHHDRLIGMLYLRGGQLRRMQHAAKLEIFVDARMRGLGVGRTLMEQGLRWAEAHPTIRKIGLSVFSDNERAIRLYRSLQFAVEGHRREEFQEPDGTLRGDLLMYRWVDGRPLPEAG